MSLCERWIAMSARIGDTPIPGAPLRSQCPWIWGSTRPCNSGRLQVRYALWRTRHGHVIHLWISPWVLEGCTGFYRSAELRFLSSYTTGFLDRYYCSELDNFFPLEWNLCELIFKGLLDRPSRDGPMNYMYPCVFLCN